MTRNKNNGAGKGDSWRKTDLKKYWESDYWENTSYHKKKRAFEKIKTRGVKNGKR